MLIFKEEAGSASQPSTACSEDAAFHILEVIDCNDEPLNHSRGTNTRQSMTCQQRYGMVRSSLLLLFFWLRGIGIVAGGGAARGYKTRPRVGVGRSRGGGRCRGR